MTLRRVVVVGGSIAAVTAVQTLRAADFDGSITVLSDEGSQPYTRVPLSKKVLAGNESLESVALAPMSDAVDLRLRTPAVGLDPRGRTVRTAGGDVSYDGLIIATGARARRIGTADQDERVLRTQQDCLRLRDEIARCDSVLIVGGGFLGMEIASTCCTLGKQVTVIDVAPPLDRLLGATVGGAVRAAAIGRGVRIEVEGEGVRLIGSPAPTGVLTADGRRWEADVVISAVGDIPNVEWLEGSGIRLGAGVLVDQRCRVSPEIVAAGEVALSIGQGGNAFRTPTWTNAVEQARAAALALLHGEDAPVYRPSMYAWTEQFGLHIKMAGPPGPAGVPVTSEGSLEALSALLTWPSDGGLRQVIGVNHPAPPAKLKRMLGARQP
ncbi:NAD(P)/FAD-dependent oxidoreductase [Nakamurella sp. PAMC28650]|uniref:NAD(P)/FAD-dependent oxidoreductase n=1 Tax=Nakamurella sp. PAMC28650 TaxID=2762325 RepID=UPI001C9A712A|nr:FAD-dependent oxidoreductase [Nakamurella sp. PAMC28650]